MTHPDDWEDLREAWRPAQSAATRPEHEPEVAALIARAARARRGMAILNVAEGLIVIVAIAAIVAARRHASNVTETVLGLSVSIAIGIAWTLRAVGRRRERSMAATSALEYLSILRVVRERQMRFVRFGWLVLAFELVFLVPWWSGGIAVHRGQLTALVAIATLWIPLAAIAAFVAWTVRLRVTARAELRQLAQIERGLREV